MMTAERQMTREEAVALWQEAASFAARAHAGQLRKDGRTPYITHCFRVTLTVRDLFGCDDPICLAAALLHDTIEDTTVDFDDLAERFGGDVARCVAALTKDMRLPEAEREIAYDEALRAADWRAKLIKLADVHDNLCDLSGDPQQVLGRCRRALELARPAERQHPAVARAVEAVELLVRRRCPAE